MAGRLLSHRLAVVYEEDPEVLRENLRGVFALLRLWLRGGTVRLGITLDPMLTLLTTEHGHTGGAHARASSRGSEAVRRRLTGLQLLSALFEGHYPLLTRAAAGLCGAALAVVAATDASQLHAECADLQAGVEGVLLNMLTQKAGCDDVACCLRALTKVHSRFLGRELFLRITATFKKLAPRAKYGRQKCVSYLSDITSRC